MSFEDKLRNNLQEVYPGMGKVRETTPMPQGSSETNPTVNKAVKGGGSDSVKKAGDATVLSPSSGGRDEKPPVQGDSEPNPSKEDLGADEPGKVAAAKMKKGPVPTNKGAGKGHGTTDAGDPTSVVNQASSKGNVMREDLDADEEVITEDEFAALSPEEQEEWELVEFEDDLDEEITDEELDEFLESLDEDELAELLEELGSEDEEDEDELTEEELDEFLESLDEDELAALTEELEALDEGEIKKANKAKKNAYQDSQGDGHGREVGRQRRATKYVEDRIKSKIGKKASSQARIKRDVIRDKHLNIPDAAIKTFTKGRVKESFTFDPAVLFEGDTTLTEEFKTKAASLFEAVVSAKVAEVRQNLEEEAASIATEALSEHLDNLVNVLDGYLTETAKEWIAQNELAVENGLRTEITESFIHGLKNLFAESYIDVPEDKLDVISELAQEIEALREELNTTNSIAEEVVAELHEVKKAEILRQVSEGLAMTQADKLKTLTEDVTFEDEESFRDKLLVIRESFFNSKPEKQEVISEEKVVDDTIARLANLMPKSATFSK